MAPPLHKAIQKPKAFATKVQAYIDECLKRDEKGKDKLITMAGLALHLGCEKASLVRWAKQYAPAPDSGEAPLEDEGGCVGSRERGLLHDPEHHIYHALKKAKAASESQLEQDCYRNKNAMALALGKCMFGWLEAQHVQKHELALSGNITVKVDTGVSLPSTAPEKD